MNRSKVKTKSIQILCTRLPSSVPIMSSNDILTTCFGFCNTVTIAHHRLICFAFPSLLSISLCLILLLSLFPWWLRQ